MNKEFEDFLAECGPPKSSKVRWNPNKKTISVEGQLYGLNKTFKVLNPYEGWIDLEGYYLENGILSITEITFLLGYSEDSAFHRAFKSWTGMTPNEYRQGQL